MSREEFAACDDFIDVYLINEKQMTDYVKVCREINCRFRVLYVEVQGTQGDFDSSLHDNYAKEEAFLGYDVGQLDGDYYSALMTDVIWRPKLLGDQFGGRLNQYGLFDRVEDGLEYLSVREKLKGELPDMTFEGGEMQIMAVYQVEESSGIEQLQGKSVEVDELMIKCQEGQLIMRLSLYVGRKRFHCTFRNVTGISLDELYYPMQIMGFEILDNKKLGWESAQRYTVRDYEDGKIRFWCEEVEVEPDGWRE
ncbi:MAG: hypothetical protein IJ315_04265 [Firmicutes bacterium]|nr:hypothetical protein [Bacillota bacterium]